MAVLLGWPARQLDVKNPFLHRYFIDAHQPNHVLQLQKALCDLKQAPRAWFYRFSSFLIH